MKPILSVVWAAGKLGAAHYDVETAEMFLLPDIAETAPHFEVLKMLFEQVNPSYIIASTRQDERFTSALKELCGENEIETGILDDPSTIIRSQQSQSSQRSSSSISINSQRQNCSQSSSATLRRIGRSRSEIRNPGNVPSAGDEFENLMEIDNEDKCQLLLLPGKDFAPDPCKARLQSQRLPDESKTFTEAEHLVYITALIQFKNVVMVRAAGALLRFLDRNGIERLQIELTEGRVPVLDIRICKMDDLVMVDETAWNSLQVFNNERHPSGIKGNVVYNNKEGLSIFSLLNKCASAHGSKFLRLTLSRPTRNFRVLKRRHEVVAFCYSALHLDFVQNCKDCLKSIKSFPKLLYKLSILHATDKEWKELYQSIYHCLLLTEIVAGQTTSIELFTDIVDPERMEILKNLSHEMMRVVDFEESFEKERFVPKVGVDVDLDHKRQQFSGLPQILAAVAAEEMRFLPDYVQQCRTIYIPEVGYLLAVNFWREDLSIEELQLEGYDLHFKAHDVAYYKSVRSKELDEILGDCQVAIMDMETTVLINLSQTILQHKQSLLKIGILASELDCLMGMAAAAREYNFVRPEIIEGGGNLEIKDGRHPLVAAISDSDFVPNSTSLEGAERVVILTGPNASGKSIYLKQIGIIVLMALSGSFVPASFARIPAVDRICTRIYAKESVSDGMSTFLIDVSQMANALKTSTKASLVIVDEFGKGTTEADGLGLLVATIQDFMEWDENCPIIFLSTHFYSIMQYLQASPTIKLQTMEFVEEDGEIVYLYKLKEGMCKSSLSHLIAAKVGVSDDIIQRSLEIHNILSNQLGDEHIIPLPLATEGVPAEKKATYIRIAQEFRALDLEDTSFDIVKYLDYLGEQFAPYLPKLNPAPSDHLESNQSLRNLGAPGQEQGQGQSLESDANLIPVETPVNSSASGVSENIATANINIRSNESPFQNRNQNTNTDTESDTNKTIGNETCSYFNPNPAETGPPYEYDANGDEAVSLDGDSNHSFEAGVYENCITPQDIFVSNQDIRRRNGFGVDLFSLAGDESSRLNLLYRNNNKDEDDDLEDIGPSASNFGNDCDDNDDEDLDDEMAKVDDEEVASFFPQSPSIKTDATSSMVQSSNYFFNNPLE